MNICLITSHPDKKLGIICGISEWTDILLNEDKIDKFFIVNTTTGYSNPPRNFLKRLILGIKVTKRILRDLKKTLKEHKIDIVHLNTSASLALIKDREIIRICHKHKIKIVYHFHFGRIFDLCHELNWEYNLLMHNVSKVDKAIVMDKKSYNCVKDNDKFVYVPNPVNIPINISNLQNKNIIFVGRVVQEKGIFELLNAWNNLSKKYQDWTLDIIGPCEPSIVRNFNNKLSCLNNTIYHGKMNHEQTLEKMKNSSIFILPSYTEGFPNVVLEAMSMHLCIIGTSVGAIPEALRDDCGVLIAPKNSIQIELALDDLIKNENKIHKMADNAYKKAINLYSSKKVCSQYYNIWKSLID